MGIQKTILSTGYRVPLPDTWWVHAATLSAFQELCATSESAATEPYKLCMKGMKGIFPTEWKQFLENTLLLVHSIYCPLHKVSHFSDAIKEILQRNGPPCSHERLYFQSMESAKNKSSLSLQQRKALFSYLPSLGNDSDLLRQWRCHAFSQSNLVVTNMCVHWAVGMWLV